MWLMILSSALASPIVHHHDGGLIAEHHDMGLLDDAEAAWLSYLLHVEPDSLPAEYAAELELRDGGSCMTGLVMQLEDVWDELDSERRERITAQLAPFKDDLFAPMPARPRPPGARAPADTCWGQQAENRLTGEHFSVEWDDGIITTATAQDFLDALEYGLEVQIDELGWQEPSGYGDYLYMAYVQTGGASAYTTVSSCGSEAVPYIVAGNASFGSSNWYQDMAAHEFNHALQFGYGYAFEFWWWEATATYMQDDVYPTHEWWSTYVTGYADNPWLAMNASSQSDTETFYHMYGMSILGFYLDQYVGGEDFVRQTWQYSLDEGRGTYSLSIWDAVDGLGYDWDEAMEGFSTTNTVMDYDDQRYYPDIDVHQEITELPKKATESGGRKALGVNGQNYITIDVDLATSDEPNLAVEVESTKNSAFRVWLVSSSGTEVKNVVEVGLQNGDGVGYLPDFGGYKEAWAVISPTEDRGDMEYTLRFDLASDEEAGLAEPEDTDTPSDTEDTDGPGDTDTDGGNEECGCASSSGGSIGWLLPLLALGAVRRRQRSTITR